MSGNIISALQAANNKSREFLVELEDTAVLMGFRSASEDRGLTLSKAATKLLIKETEAAIASGDVVKMVHVAKAHGL